MPSASVPPPAASVLTSEAEHDPELWLRALSWAVVVFSMAQVVVFSFGRDQGAFGVLAEGILRGQLPYRDLWDYQPPGIYLLYAASFVVFGKTMMAPRLVEALLLIGAVLGLRRLGGVFFQSRTAGIMAGAVYSLVHAQMDFHHSGQPESFAGPLAVYALVLATHPWSKRHASFAHWGTGLLFGMAFLLKPAVGGGAAACAYYLAARRQQDGYSLKESLKPVLWISLSSLLPILLCLGWFKINGGWDDIRWMIFEYTPHLAASAWQGKSAGGMFFRSTSEAFFGVSSLLAMGTIAAASIHPRASREREGFLLILGVLAFQFVGVAVEGTFALHHFGATVPLIALIAGHGYYKLYCRVALDSHRGLLAFSLFVVACATMHPAARDTPLGFWNRSGIRMKYLLSGGISPNRAELDEKIHYVGTFNLDLARRAAEELSRHAPPGTRTFVWGAEPIIYSLSQTIPASRHINKLPQVAFQENTTFRASLMSDLRENTPGAIITQPRDAHDDPAEFAELQTWLHQNYRLESNNDHFSLWLPTDG